MARSGVPRGVVEEHRFVIQPAPDPGLVGGDDRQKTVRMRSGDQFEDARHPVGLLGRMHVTVVDVDHAIAIKKQRLAWCRRGDVQGIRRRIEERRADQRRTHACPANSVCARA